MVFQSPLSRNQVASSNASTSQTNRSIYEYCPSRASTSSRSAESVDREWEEVGVAWARAPRRMSTRIVCPPTISTKVIIGTRCNQLEMGQRTAHLGDGEHGACREGRLTRRVCDVVLGYFCPHGSEYRREIDDGHTIPYRFTQLTEDDYPFVCKRAACEDVHKPIDSCGLTWSERGGLHGRGWKRSSRASGVCSWPQGASGRSVEESADFSLG